MMTITFRIGPPCPGGNHFDVTTTLNPGGSFVLPFSKEDLKAALTADEREATVRVLLKLLVRQLLTATPAQLKTAIEGKTIDLSVSA